MTASKPSVVERLTAELERRGRLAPPRGPLYRRGDNPSAWQPQPEPRTEVTHGGGDIPAGSRCSWVHVRRTTATPDHDHVVPPRAYHPTGPGHPDATREGAP